MPETQVELFKEIWEELEPEERVSFVNGHPLEDQHTMHTFYFSHVLSKGAFPRFKLKKKNVVLMTFDQHRLWEVGQHKIRANKHLYQMWKHVFELEEELKREYYGV